MNGSIEGMHTSMVSFGQKMNLIWRALTMTTLKQLIMKINSLTYTYKLGNLAPLPFQTNPFCAPIQKIVSLCQWHIFLELIHLMIMNNSLLTFNNTQNAPKAPDRGIVINNLGNYIQPHPRSLTPTTKRHKPSLTIIID